MIGSRTVVQVRTHAQKYFQKMERRHSTASKASVSTAISSPKRVQATRSKKLSPKHSMRITLSMQHKTVSTDSTEVRKTVDHLVNPVSADSLMTSSTLSLENLSTISPNNVLDLADANEGLYLDEVEDPLEWLMDGGVNRLPESTLLDATAVGPIFPDLASAQQEDATDQPPALHMVDPVQSVQSLFLD